MKSDLSKSATVRLPFRVAIKLEVLCAQRGISKAAYIRKVLSDALKRERVKVTAFDLMKDAIGCIHGGKKDSSTNPKYMRGYGRSRRDGMSRKR